MKIFYHKSFLNNLENFSSSVKKKLRRQVSYLTNDIRHPSLHAKKYDESQNIWQARVDKSVRFYFSIEDDVYTLLEIKKHPK